MSSTLQLVMTTGSLLIAYIFDLTGVYTTGWYIILGLSFITLFAWVLAYQNGKKLSYIK